MKPAIVAAFAMAVFVAVLVAVPARADEDCRLQIVAALPLSMHATGRVSVPAALGDKPLQFIVDTGARFSTLTQAAVDKLGLETRTVTAHAKFRVYGGEHLSRYVRVKDFKIGALTAPSAEFLVMSDLKPENIDGLLGADFISQFDVDFDFARGKLNLFQPHRCPGRAVYWTQDEAAIAIVPFDMEPNDTHIEIPAVIDGKRIRAIVDTGATSSVMNIEAASDLFGLKPGSDGMHAVGSSDDPNYRYPFKSLSFDGVTVTNPRITLVPEEKSHFTNYRAILGMTVLGQLHLFIAYKEHKLYVTAAGAH